MALYICIALVTVSQLVFTVLHAASCSPVAMRKSAAAPGFMRLLILSFLEEWDSSIQGQCINSLAMYFALGGTSLAWDVLIIVMPFPILNRLQLDRRSKVSLVSLYSRIADGIH